MGNQKKGLFAVISCVLFLGLATAGYSAKLPNVVACTSYGVGVAGYTVASGLGEAVNKLTPMKWRVEPYGTGIERIAPLKSKETEFTLITNVTSLLAYKGYDEFAMWGPQPLRLVSMGNTISPGMYVRGDSGIMTIADLKDKRLPDIKGNPTVMREIEAILAFGNLSYADVKKIPVAGFGAAMQAVLDGDIDASMASIFSSKVKELCSGPHGCRFLEMPAADKEGWKRAQEKLPAIFPATQAKVAGLDKPVALFGISYALYCYPWVDDNVVYNVVKSLDKGYDYFKASHPWLKQWKLDNMVKNVATIPFHPGAVNYYKEAGVWNASLEDFQSSVLK
ncbi:TAXI family TRAP transporter solute-binding subunit [bacterium]|nr:TAXI family TRAP transporter solute-binding subunit [bacterium]